MILVIAPPEDGHAQVVVRRLLKKGATVLQLDVGDFPARHLTVKLGRASRGAYSSIELAGVDLAEVRSVWYRRVGWPRVDSRLPPADRGFAYGETTAALLSLAEILDATSFAVNPLQNAIMTERGAGKLNQLALAEQCGLTIPRTLATTSPKDARAFVESCAAGAIYKPFMAPVLEDGKKKRTVFTNKLDAKDLSALDGVASAPCLFQEQIPKAYEVRATIVGDKILATEIHSQEREGSRVDFRRDYALGKTPYRVHALGSAVATALQDVMAALGLRFGCADLIVTPEGEYVFLEVNQQGQWLWLEEQTGQPILEHVCEFLLQARDAYECEACVHAPGIFPDF